MYRCADVVIFLRGVYNTSVLHSFSLTTFYVIVWELGFVVSHCTFYSQLFIDLILVYRWVFPWVPALPFQCNALELDDHPSVIKP